MSLFLFLGFLFTGEWFQQPVQVIAFSSSSLKAMVYKSLFQDLLASLSYYLFYGFYQSTWYHILVPYRFVHFLFHFHYLKINILKL